MKNYRADYVFPVNTDPIKNGVVTIDDHGRIIAVSDMPPPNVKLSDVENLKGVLCPGFVNTHCHLELSHLKDKLSQGNGLINFIKEIQSVRNADNATILKAAEKADQQMYDSGIVAVGDISNSNVSVGVKANSKIYYHTFVEAFSFSPAKAQETFDKAISLLAEFKHQSCSITPHAPYSVSKELFRLIKKYTDTNHNLISIHNQETEEENKFYRYRLGGFLDLYAHFGMDISYFKSQARNSLQSILPLLTSKQDILFVHNTYTNLKDIYFIKRFDRRVHFCFCPGANQYIESRLPKIDLFVDQGFNLTLGT
ncbi:MAG: amidohydrolase family protein, partial [Mucilaginibacter sp.]|nr:amidohydrolase family protein [Mucilaginibacter sp.]